MSQAGIVDIEGTHPQIPTLFVANVGSAVPIANTLEILGTSVVAHAVPLETVGSGNTISIDVQYASASGASVANNAGVASFDSVDFTVDANGFVSLTAIAGSTKMGVDTFTAPGTNPVDPDGSGVITVTGGQVAAGTTTNVIRTDSLALNTYTIQIQRSQAVASSTVGDNGVSHFNSNHFSVDANGFVSLNGVAAIQTITGNSGGPESPLAGNFNILGTGSITVAGSANTETIQLTGLTNHSLLVGAGTATITNLGVASNGQLPIGSTGADPVLSTLTAGTGIAIANAAGSITISTTGSGFSWIDNSGTFAAAINRGYFLTAASTVTLPASPAQGDAVAIVCDTTGSCVVTANTGQLIRISNQLSSVAGTATNSARGDTLSLVFRSATNTWFTEASPNGGWTTA